MQDSPTSQPHAGPVLNAGYAYAEQVQCSGESVLDYLARRHRHSDAEAWRDRLRGGEILVDGVPAQAEQLLRAGQRLVWNRPPWAEPAGPESCKIVHEDEALLAVLKPRGLPTLPGGGFLEQTLLARVRARYPGAIPMHRLGRETSGLVLFARTRDIATILQKAWRGREVRKFYRALGAGIAQADRFDIATPIGPVPHPRLGTIHAADPEGKPARSLAAVLERRAESTLFAVEIETGRPHQIRIHLAAVCHPLVGDPIYIAGGRPRPDDAGLPGDGGYFLHAERLELAHPLTGQSLTLNAEVPVELRTAAELLADGTRTATDARSGSGRC